MQQVLEPCYIESAGRVIDRISIAGCSICLGNSQLVVRKRTFGKVKSIACIHGRSPAILIQLARFDSIATLQLVDSRHIVSLYSITFRVLSFAIRPQSAARCSSTTVTLPSSGLTVSAVQETEFPPASNPHFILIVDVTRLTAKSESTMCASIFTTFLQRDDLTLTYQQGRAEALTFM